MNARWLGCVALLALPACQCFNPVEQCFGDHCLDGGDGGHADGGDFDAGHNDAGRSDAGHDAGYFDGGGPEAIDAGPCTLWDHTGVGMCAAVTGYVFEGSTCTGQCVQYPIASPGVYPDVATCVHACALEYCHTALLTAVLPQPFTPAAYCDELGVDTGLPWLVKEAFPELMIPDAGCPATGPTTCGILGNQTLGDRGYQEACAATLLPETTRVTCMLFGP